MVAKLTRLTHKVAMQLHLVVESCSICSSHSRQSVWKLMGTPSYKAPHYVAFSTLMLLPPSQVHIFSLDTLYGTNICRKFVVLVLLLLLLSLTVKMQI